MRPSDRRVAQHTSAALAAPLDAQRAAFANEPCPTLAARRDRLARIGELMRSNEHAFVAAIDADFGHRAAQETRIAEMYVVAAEARHALRNAVSALYPTIAGNADYASIVSAKHYARLVRLIDDARAKVAQVVALGEGDPDRRVLAPTILVGVDNSMAVMQQEIFGPVLPIETVRGHADAVLRHTRAGGATIGDTLWHFAHTGLPFGGIGASGSGAYHGETGFLTFTHRKRVFVQPRIAFTRWLYPPYGARFERLLALLRRFNG